jgi:hypothetical protein
MSEIDVVLPQKIQIPCYFLARKSERKKCVEKENYQLWKGICVDSQKWEAKITAGNLSVTSQEENSQLKIF